MLDLTFARAPRARLAALLLFSSGCSASPLFALPLALPPESQGCVENSLRRGAEPEMAPLAVAQFSRACGAGDAPSCSALGVAVELGRGVESDLGRAGALYRRACRAGNTRACDNLALLVQRASPTFRSALLFPRDACDPGQGGACAALAGAK